ncbi:pirin family protein [Luteibacter aegosomatis]|uniref:pirin family protein n=1 Tax=Luteibacter aegosomatis TaxID=2911537 RepID=UPI001FF7A43F|nr:pirin family protein [Luteibacter aegosomatis]UPG87218.1 pirin family protein [Luteibacter aegosomatis]
MTAISIEGKQRDLGDGFVVRRLLPNLKARHVGPFVFFDHFGPASFHEDAGLDIRPHPHIGLATVTWLFEGALRHRDSLGSLVDIHPGDVNWMTAGRGIVHSERTPPDERHHGQDIHGVQVWVALPKAHEEVEPEFHHHGKASLPTKDIDGGSLVVVVGDAYGERSPVKVFSPMFLVQARLRRGTRLPMPEEHAESGVYVIEGKVSLGGLTLGAKDMAVAFDGERPELSVDDDALVMLFGGEKLDGERHMWWNFVASSPELIERAKADWKVANHERFPKVPGDENERIPLPEH